MKSKVLIKNPCPVNLDRMPRVAGGIYCTICSEKVEDLTTHTEEQLVKWLSEKSKNTPCAIYRDDQATMPLTQRIIFPFRYAAISVASFFAVKETIAQVQPFTGIQDSSMVFSGVGDTAQMKITGTVLSKKNGKPLSGVNVYVSDTEKTIASVKTKSDGTFECTLPYRTDTTFTLTFDSDRSYRTETIYGYVPCDKSLVIRMEKMTRNARKRSRRVVSKF